MSVEGVLSSSFRDPSGFLFEQQGSLYRQVNFSYKEHYDRLIGSGLHAQLTDAGMVVQHQELPLSDFASSAAAYKVLRPEPIEFISYPYEWCFSAYKDAALLTLELQKRALEKGMILKDASAYNIQFVNGKPVLIDTLSFEIYREGAPWAAYRQFCQHFLAPLACMSFVHIDTQQLLRAYIDGFPLELAVRMLPLRSFLRIGIFTHIYLHALSQSHFAKSTSISKKSVAKFSLRALVDSLEGAIRGLTWKPGLTTWSNYYSETNYSEEAAASKKVIVEQAIELVAPKSVWDIGANRGDYSRIASAKGLQTVSFDFDPVCVELSYQELKRAQERNLLPLRMDFTNPSPALGFAHQERSSLVQRGPADLILCLAFVHHMAIANNVPFSLLARYLSGLGRNLLIEFVSKDDSQVQRLLASRADVFESYDEHNFEKDFGVFFSIKHKYPVRGSSRVIYLMSALQAKGAFC